MGRTTNKAAVAFTLWLISTGSSGLSLFGSSREDRIALHEAKILMFLSPDARSTMADGWQIEWHIQATENWYFFSAYNASRPNPVGSVTIGHYAVNRHTAAVLDSVTGGMIESPELTGVQAIVRHAHKITAKIISAWEKKSPLENEHRKFLGAWTSSYQK